MTNQRLAVAAATLAAASSLFATACSENSPTGLSPGQPRLSVAHADSVRASNGKGIFRARRAFDGTPTPTPTGAMTPHNRSILLYTNTYAFFAGPSWNTDPNFTTDKITSIESFFEGFGGSNYANIVTEYGPTNQSTFRGSFVDNGNPPNGADGNAVGSYVCLRIQAAGFSPDLYGVYTVYSTEPPPPDPNDPRYIILGYHTQIPCFGVTIKFAIVFNMDGLGTVTDPLHYHSDNAAALVNTTAHELQESITDPNPGSGWYAQNTGGEIGDKCNFEFGPSPYITLSNGAVFKVQEEWSNHAFQTGSGDANVNNEPGCINSAPSPPAPQISGATYVGQFATCNWSGAVTGGAPPFTYFWTVNTYNSSGQAMGSWVPTVGSSQNFSSEFYNNQQFTTGYASFEVTDSWGRTATAQKNLTSILGGSCY